MTNRPGRMEIYAEGATAPALCGGIMDINKFTEKAREAIGEAQTIAAGMGHQETDAEHLALALVQQEKGIVPRILEHMGIQPKALAVALETSLRKRPSVSGGMDPPSPRVWPSWAKPSPAD